MDQICVFCSTPMDIDSSLGEKRTHNYPGSPPHWMAGCPHCDATLSGDGIHYSDPDSESALKWTATGQSIKDLTNRMAYVFEYIKTDDIEAVLPDLIQIIEDAEKTAEEVPGA